MIALAASTLMGLPAVTTAGVVVSSKHDPSKLGNLAGGMGLNPYRPSYEDSYPNLFDTVL
jgi:hypothetical protein